MAYACPVCDQPQVDAEHLANHLAFTAIGGDDAHEAWLDETVEGWGQLGQAELAEVVVEHAEETDFPIDMGEADVGAGGGEHDHEHGADVPPASMPSGDLDEDAEDVLAEARELTRRMQDDDGDGETGSGSDGEDGASTTNDGSESTDSTATDRSDSETQ